MNAFFFELDKDQAAAAPQNALAADSAIATESWHLQLKNEMLERIFVLPPTEFAVLWQEVSQWSETTVLSDIKSVVAYSLSKAAIPTQERNRSYFMHHVLQVIKHLNHPKLLPVVASILKQPTTYFELYFNTFPADGLLEAVLACANGQENKLLTFVKAKDVPPKSKYLYIEAFVLIAMQHKTPHKLWGILEKFFNQAERVADTDSIPKDFFNQVTKLMIKYRLEHFEYYIRQLFMFGLIKPERIGSLEVVVSKLNESFDLRNLTE
ncbi:MAG: hypothetical protein LAT76_05115 [Schleiferiaceae bacterium]|nr:hypothetical protein [Schleiferiaceae bacterium]